MREENFKWTQWVPNNQWADWEAPGKFDLQDKHKLIIIEAKARDEDPRCLITQAVLTAAKEKKLYKIIGAITPNNEMWIDMIENNISIRSYATFKSAPSNWGTDDWKKCHSLLWQGLSL